MVIQVSKEIDVVRIGIDRYSLKTGCNFRTIMDLSVRVMKEPRGFIRALQCVMAILAFSTTVGFTTMCEFSMSCTKDTEIKIAYAFGYPFDENILLQLPEDCSNPELLLDLRLPFDYSTGAEFYVATGVLSFLYTIAILVVYVFFHQTYASNPKLPVADLGVSAVLTIFWMAGSSAWAQSVSDLKYYLNPDTLFRFLPICLKDHGANDCKTLANGSYGTLNASLVLGFANFLLWTASLWFVYKETMFHKEEEIVQEPAQNQIGRQTDIRRV